MDCDWSGQICWYFSCASSLFVCQQLGCFMGFSITACVITGIMFISYCFAVDEFAKILRCRNTYDYVFYYGKYCHSPSRRHLAQTGAGLGSGLLIFSLVEFFVALASSIYCCTGVCCNTMPGAVGTVSILICFVYFYLHQFRYCHVKSEIEIMFNCSK